jgi:hypothetical protein
MVDGISVVLLEALLLDERVECVDESLLKSSLDPL